MMTGFQKILVLFLLSLLCQLQAQGQEKTEKLEAGAQYHYGFLWGHRTGLKVLNKGYVKSLELSFYKKFHGSEDWELKYRYPSLGGSFMYFDFANPEQMGYGFAAFAFYDFPLVGGDNASLNFKIGLGPGYVTKVFERNENIKNYGLSTRLNGFAYLSLKGKFRLYEGLKIHAGVALSHFSNASYKKPNLGINLPSATLGLTYGFQEVELLPRKERSAYTFAKKIDHDVFLNYGMKEKNPVGGELHEVYSLSYSASRLVTFKSRVGLGMDMFYNSAYKGELNGNGQVIERFGQVFQLGFSVLYAVQVSNFSIIMNPGYYVVTDYIEDGYVYSRFGARYVWKDHYMLNISMKTHFAVADHVEYGIGYRF